MTNSKRQRPTGLAPASWASALVLAAVLAAPASSYARADAAPDVTAPADAAPAAPATVEPSPATPAPAAPEEATAPAAAPPTALDNLSSEVMNILVPIFVSLIGALFALMLNWARRKLKLNVSDQQLFAWQGLAEKASLRGGEWARKKIKDLAEGEKLPGPEVLEVAVNWAIEMGKAARLPEMGREKLEGLIEGHIYSLRKQKAAETTARTG